MAEAEQPRSRRETTEELENALALLRAREELLSMKIAEKRRQISELNRELISSVNTERECARKITTLRSKLLARAPLPPEIENAHTALIEKIRLIAGDATAAVPRKDIPERIILERYALEERCTHSFIFSYDGYAGSSSHGFADAHHGHRVCAVCNRRETSRGNSTDLYKVLKEDPARLIRRDLRKGRDLAEDNEWFHLGFLRQLFEDSADGSLLRWPEKFDEYLVRETWHPPRRFIV